MWGTLLRRRKTFIWHGAMIVLQRKITFMSTSQKGQTVDLNISEISQMVLKLMYVKEVFDEVSDDNLLTKCVHGKTQNRNEAFDGPIWNRIRKSRFIGYKQFVMSILDAAVHFNSGNLATLLIYDKMSMERGFHTTNGCLDENTRHLRTRIEKIQKV